MKDNEINWVKCFRKLKSIDEKEIGQHDLSFYKNIDFIWLSSLENDKFYYILPMSYKCHCFINSFNAGGSGSQICTGTKNNPNYYFYYLKQSIMSIFCLSKTRINDIKYVLDFTETYTELFNNNGDSYINSNSSYCKDILSSFIELNCDLSKLYLSYKDIYFNQAVCPDNIELATGTEKQIDWNYIYNRRHISVCSVNEKDKYESSDLIKLAENDRFIFMVPMNYKACQFYISFSCGGEGAKCCLGTKYKFYYYYYMHFNNLQPCIILSKFRKYGHIKYMFADMADGIQIYNQANEELLKGTSREAHISFLKSFFSLDFKDYKSLYNVKIQSIIEKNATISKEALDKLYEQSSHSVVL